MQVVAMAHFWPTDTQSKYQGNLSAFAQFESEYDICVIHPTPLLHEEDIGLLWMMESYSLHQSCLTGMGEFCPLSNANV
jgi:hypothetical protein